MHKSKHIKKTAFWIIYLVIVYLILEGISWTFFNIKEEVSFSFSKMQQFRQAVVRLSPELAPADGRIAVPSFGTEVIHPYLGFVMNPEEKTGYSQYGFRGAPPVFEPVNGGVFVVGIFGGSFADGTAQYGSDALIEQLRQIPALANHEIIVESIALGGYKQPQQVLALTYFLSIGAHFDLIINLDGFNEVALSQAEDRGRVFPFYPRAWPVRVGNILDTTTLKLLGEMTHLDEQMIQWAHFCSWPWFTYNVTANVLWYYRHLNLSNRRMDLSRQQAAHGRDRTENYGYLIKGPSFQYESEAEMYRDLARIWFATSVQMHHLCRANGIDYFHFLQPNQYVPGSKTLTTVEEEEAFYADHPYRQGVLKGYPLLIEAGQTLQRDGINFFDLTPIYKDNPATLYVDTCCHVNSRGYQIVGTAIGREIRTYYRAQH